MRVLETERMMGEGEREMGRGDEIKRDRKRTKVGQVNTKFSFGQSFESQGYTRYPVRR